MFSLMWGPTVAAVSVVLDHADDMSTVRQALDGLLQAAKLGAYHHVDEASLLVLPVILSMLGFHVTQHRCQACAVSSFVQQETCVTCAQQHRGFCILHWQEHVSDSERFGLLSHWGNSTINKQHGTQQNLRCSCHSSVAQAQCSVSTCSAVV